MEVKLAPFSASNNGNHRGEISSTEATLGSASARDEVGVVRRYSGMHQIEKMVSIQVKALNEHHG